MTNEAVRIEGPYNARRYNCADVGAITKYTLLALVDGTVSGASFSAGSKAFAGIAAMDKVSSDGSTTISVYTDGIFDLIAGEAITGGSLVTFSGSNFIANATAAMFMSGAVVGKALEDASNQEVIRVAVGSII